MINRLGFAFAFVFVSARVHLPSVISWFRSCLPITISHVRLRAMDDRSSDGCSSTSLKLSSLNHTGAAILLHSHSEENIPDSPRRQSSWQTVLAELRGPQRLWTTTLGVVVASLSTLLGGYTLGFASPALLQLNHNHVPAEYHLEGAILGLFAVSQFNIHMHMHTHARTHTQHTHTLYIL